MRPLTSACFRGGDACLGESFKHAPDGTTSIQNKDSEEQQGRDAKLDETAIASFLWRKLQKKCSLGPTGERVMELLLKALDDYNSAINDTSRSSRIQDMHAYEAYQHFYRMFLDQLDVVQFSDGDSLTDACLTRRLNMAETLCVRGLWQPR